MARPTTKQDLITAANGEFEKLWKLIDSLPEEKQNATFAFEDRDRNIRDVLVHLNEWHQLLLKWIQSNQAGNKANFLPDPYNWKTYPQMNVEFWKKHQSTPLEEAKTVLKASHSDVIQLIATFSDEELFMKKYFSWTGTTNLGSYCISATSSHYDWAIKKIKQHIKN
jgi:Uncharacterized conserved protein